VRHTDLAKALPVFAHIAGLSNVEVLRSATSDCAQAIGLGHLTGRLVAGYSADVLFVDGDPLTDLARLGSVVGVLTRGRDVPGTQ
jgi:imidazolonepropionase-like amidohydrolase